MYKIYSKVKPDVLLHIIFRKETLASGPERAELVESNEVIQCSALRLQEGKTFKPHKHNTDNKEVTTTQESWVVIQGRVKAIYYDLDDQIIEEVELGPGDLGITLRGGHNYLILEDNTLVYEYKTGPYYGQARDKTFI